MANWILDNAGEIRIVDLPTGSVPRVVKLEVPDVDGGLYTDSFPLDEPGTNIIFTSYVKSSPEDFVNINIVQTLSEVPFIQYIHDVPDLLDLHGFYFDPKGSEGESYKQLKSFISKYRIDFDTERVEGDYFDNVRRKIDIEMGTEYAQRITYEAAYLVEGEIGGRPVFDNFPVFPFYLKFIVEPDIQSITTTTTTN